MKNIRLSYFIVACTVVLFTGCGSSDPSQMFARKWKVSNVDSKTAEDRIAMAQKELKDATDQTQKITLQQRIDNANSQIESLKKMALDCKKDGTMEITLVMMGQPLVMKGKWILLDGGKQVQLNVDNYPKPITLSIDELTADKMVISGADESGIDGTVTYQAVN